MLTITRHEEFEMAHILTGYKGGCGNLHGHSYKIEVTVSGPQNPNYFDMIMDFKDLKSAIKKVIPDHKFVYNGLSLNTGNVEDELVKVLNVDKRDIVKYNFVTTAENMVQYFAKEITRVIQEEMGYKEIRVVKVKLWETTNSYAEWSE